MTLEQHIEELRLELKNCWNREERRDIETELEAALGELDTWLNEMARDLRDPRPPH